MSLSPLRYEPDPWRKPLPDTVVARLKSELAFINSYPLQATLNFLHYYGTLELEVDTPVLEALVVAWQPSPITHQVHFGTFQDGRHWMKLTINLVGRGYYCYASAHWLTVAGAPATVKPVPDDVQFMWGTIVLAQEHMTRDENAMHHAFTLNYHDWHRFLHLLYCNTPPQDLAETYLRTLPVYVPPQELESQPPIFRF